MGIHTCIVILHCAISPKMQPSPWKVNLPGVPICLRKGCSKKLPVKTHQCHKGYSLCPPAI